MGFTVVRLPFSSEMLRARQVPEGAIDYELNPGLRGLSPLEVYDRVVDALGDCGVAVVVNNHTTLGLWSGGPAENGLWYLEGSEEYTEDSWIGDWLSVACRYADRPHVIGYDLRNEVRPTTLLGTMAQGPGWGSGDERDWALAAGNCARALVAQETTNALIIVERLAWPQASLASMLEPTPPWEAWGVPRDRLVLSLHMYAWSGPGYWSPKAFVGHLTHAFLQASDFVRSSSLYGELDEQTLEKQMDADFGFCLDQDLCPVWLSEFGADLNSEYERPWFVRVCQYLRRKDVDFAYWPLNVGAKPGGNEDESYGLLTNDWQPRWADRRVRALRQLMPSALGREGTALLRSPSLLFRFEDGCVAEDDGGLHLAHALAPPPWCAPLPGPLVPWPEEARLKRGQLPAPRYLWVSLHGRDSDPGQDATVAFGGLPDMKRQCLEGGFEGFALHKDAAYMRRASADELKSRLQDGFNETVLFLAEEVRLCAVWNIFTEEFHAEACGEDPADTLELPGDAASVHEACQRACLSRGYHGYETRSDRLGWARLLSQHAAAGMRSRLGLAPVANNFPQDECPPVRHLHFVEHTLVRVRLEAIAGRDAFPGCNALVLRGASIAECKRLCLQAGFGGFAMYRGDAYFRTAAADSLRRGLVPYPGSTFYILVCDEIATARGPDNGFAKSAARREILGQLMPKLWQLQPN